MYGGMRTASIQKDLKLPFRVGAHIPSFRYRTLYGSRYPTFYSKQKQCVSLLQNSVLAWIIAREAKEKLYDLRTTHSVMFLGDFSDLSWLG